MVPPPSDLPTGGTGRRGAFLMVAAFLLMIGAVVWWIASSPPLDTPPDSAVSEVDDRPVPAALDVSVPTLPGPGVSVPVDRVVDVPPPFVVEVLAPHRALPASPAIGARVAWLPRSVPPTDSSLPIHPPMRHEIEHRALQNGGLATTDKDGRVNLALPDDDVEVFAWTADAFASRAISASFRRSLTRLLLVLQFDVALDVLVVAANGHGAAGVDVLIGRECAARTDVAGRARVELVRRFAPHPASSVQVVPLGVDYPGAIAGADPTERLDPWQHPQQMRVLTLPPTGSIEIAVHGDVPWTQAQLHVLDARPGFVRTFVYPRTRNGLSVVVPHVALGHRYAVQVDLAPEYGGMRAMTVDGPTTPGERVVVDLRTSEVLRVVGSIVLDPAPPQPLTGQLELEIVGATHRWSDTVTTDGLRPIGSVRTTVRHDNTFEFVLPPATFSHHRQRLLLAYISETRGVSHTAFVERRPTLGFDVSKIDLGQVTLRATQTLIEGIVVTAHGVTAEVHAKRMVRGAPIGPALTNVPVDSEGRFRVRMPMSAPRSSYSSSSVEVRATAPFHMPAVRVVEAGSSVRIELARAATLETTTTVPLAFGANVDAEDLRIELTPLPGTEPPKHADPDSLVAKVVDVLDAGEFFLVLHRFEGVVAGRYRVAHRVLGLGELHVLEDLPVVARETCEPTWLHFDLRDHVRMLHVVVRDPDGERTRAAGHLEVRRGTETGVFPLHAGYAAIPFGGTPIRVTACVDGFRL